MGSSPSRRRACRPLPASQGRMFFPSRFSSSFKSSEGLAPFVALDPAFCAPISTDVVRPQASKWADPKERHPSPAHEAEGRGQTEARRLQENNVRSLARTRFEPILNGRAPALRSCGVCNASLFRAYPFGSPFFEAERPFVGAHLARRHPATG